MFEVCKTAYGDDLDWWLISFERQCLSGSENYVAERVWHLAETAAAQSGENTVDGRNKGESDSEPRISLPHDIPFHTGLKASLLRPRIPFSIVGLQAWRRFVPIDKFRAMNDAVAMGQEARAEVHVFVSVEECLVESSDFKGTPGDAIAVQVDIS